MENVIVIVARSPTIATQESLTRMILVSQILMTVNPEIIVAFYGNTNAMEGAGFSRALPLGKYNHYKQCLGFPYFSRAVWGFSPTTCW